MPDAAAGAETMTGPGNEELKPSGPDQLNDAPALPLVADKVMLPPAHTGPLFEATGAGGVGGNGKFTGPAITTDVQPAALVAVKLTYIPPARPKITALPAAFAITTAVCGKPLNK